MSDTTTASELLIKVKSDLESKGLDEAIAKVDQLIGMQSQSTAALLTNKAEQSNSAKEMEKANPKTPEEMAAAKSGAIRAKISAAMVPGYWYRLAELSTMTGLNRESLRRHLHAMNADQRGETRTSEWSLAPVSPLSPQEAF
jgi:hypothetical protein